MTNPTPAVMIADLLDAGWSLSGIARALGTVLHSVQRWHAGDYQPGRDHAPALTALWREARFYPDAPRPGEYRPHSWDGVPCRKPGRADVWADPVSRHEALEAAALCRACPALADCALQRYVMARDGLKVAGVMAGKIPHKIQYRKHTNAA